MNPSQRSRVPLTKRAVTGISASPRTGTQSQLEFWPGGQTSDVFSLLLPLSLQSNDEPKSLKHKELLRVVVGINSAADQFRNLSDHAGERLHRLGALRNFLSALTDLEGTLRHVAGGEAAASRLLFRQNQKIARQGGMK